MVHIRRVHPDDWQEWRRVRLDALGDAPHAFGATLADWQGDGDQEERWRGRLEQVPFNVIADVDGAPAGMVSGYTDGDRVELISMWVAPRGRGQGVGDALVNAFLRWAATTGCPTVTLGVKEDNDHAIALYARHGFVDSGVRNDDSGPGTCERTMRRPGGASPGPG